MMKYIPSTQLFNHRTWTYLVGVKIKLKQLTEQFDVSACYGDVVGLQKQTCARCYFKRQLDRYGGTRDSVIRDGAHWSEVFPILISTQLVNVLGNCGQNFGGDLLRINLCVLC